MSRDMERLSGPLHAAVLSVPRSRYFHLLARRRVSCRLRGPDQVGYLVGERSRSAAPARPRRPTHRYRSSRRPGMLLRAQAAVGSLQSKIAAASPPPAARYSGRLGATPLLRTILFVPTLLYPCVVRKSTVVCMRICVWNEQVCASQHQKV